MSERDNAELLRRYIQEVWDEGNPAAVERFVDPSFRRHIAPTLPPLNLEEQVVRLQGLRTAFPDVTLELADVAAYGDLVAFRSTMRGTHRGELLGIPPTGEQVTVALVDMWRVSGGRVVEQWGGPDMFDLLRQLGATFDVAP